MDGEILDGVDDTPHVGSPSKFTENQLFIANVTRSLWGKKLECRAQSPPMSSPIVREVPLDIYRNYPSLFRYRITATRPSPLPSSNECRTVETSRRNPSIAVAELYTRDARAQHTRQRNRTRNVARLSRSLFSISPRAPTAIIVSRRVEQLSSFLAPSLPLVFSFRSCVDVLLHTAAYIIHRRKTAGRVRLLERNFLRKPIVFLAGSACKFFFSHFYFIVAHGNGFLPERKDFRPDILRRNIYIYNIGFFFVSCD